MRPTRRLWAVIGLIAFLVMCAMVFARPLLFAGAALVGGWVLAQQVRFLAALERTTASLSVQQSPARTSLRTDESIPVTMTVTVDTASPLAVTVDAGLPPASTTSDPRHVSLVPETTRTDRTIAVTWPVVGRHQFREATIALTDGLFRETITTGQTPTVTVEPRGPREIHVGAGGDRISSAYGEHEAGRYGSGIEPAEIREYIPGDTTAQIDWNATARLATPHVRQYEAETDRRTLLVMDQRGALTTGRRKETKLDYLREVALATAASAQRLGDPIGLVAIGEEGIIRRVEPASTPANYATIRRYLLELEPPTPVDERTGHSTTATPTRPNTASVLTGDHALVESRPRRRSTTADVHRTLTTSDGDTDTFAETLGPFYSDRRTYREYLDRDPLYSAVRTALGRDQGTIWTVLCTDDSYPAELRETVKFARRHGNEVLVLLAPTVLYEPGGLADVERAYDRYVSFEEFRRELTRMERVTALEVAPQDRLAAVLDQDRRQGGRA